MRILKVKNKTWRPLILPLAEHKSITLPARGSADIDAEDFNSPACQRLLAERTIIVLSEHERQRPSSSSRRQRSSAAE